MKSLIIFSLLFVSGLCFSSSVSENGVYSFNMDEVLSPEDVQKLEELVAKEKDLWDKKNLNKVSISALFNDYLDLILGNVQTLIINNGIDPTTIPNLEVDLGIGHTNLTEGQLNDTSTIQRYEDATLSYDNESKQLVADMVLRFQDLKFIYKYHTLITFISMTGHLHGDIEHIHINVKIGFDFKNYLVFMEPINFKHTGDITIWFSGNAAIDWITNLMSVTMTGILHNVILDIVKGILETPLDALVDTINKALHPTSLF